MTAALCGKNFPVARKFLPILSASHFRFALRDYTIEVIEFFIFKRFALRFALSGPMSEATENTFRDRLAAIVKQRGPAIALARAAGMTDRTLRNYLTGTTEPKAEAVERLAAAAGVRFEWLYKGSGAKDIPDAAAPLEERRAYYASDEALRFAVHHTGNPGPAYSIQRITRDATALLMRVVAECEYTPSGDWMRTLQQLLVSGDITETGVRSVIEELRAGTGGNTQVR